MASIVFTLICSIFAAFYFIANDFFKLRGDVFVFFRSVVLVAALAPFLLFVDFDRETSFYVYMTLGSAMAGVGDILLFEGNKKYSAAALSRVVVSRTIIMFVLWPLLVAGYWGRLIAHPPVFIASIVLIVISTWALSAMRKTPIGLTVLKAAVPMMVMFIGCDTMLALAVHGKPDAGDAIIGVWISGVTNMLVAALVLWRNGRKEGVNLFRQPDWFKPAAINAALFFCTVFFKTIAIAWLENPGYFGAMVAIYTFWIFLLNKYWLKRPETTDPRLGFVVVACSILLGMLAVQIPKF